MKSFIVNILLVYLAVFTSGIFLAGHFAVVELFGGDESLAIISIIIHLILIIYLWYLLGMPGRNDKSTFGSDYQRDLDDFNNGYRGPRN